MAARRSVPRTGIPGVKYLLDTDVLSIFERPGSAAHTRLLSRLERCEADEVGVSAVSYDEQAHGCHKLIFNARNPTQVLGAYDLLYKVLDAFRKYPLVKFDIDALIVFERLKSNKLRIGTLDLRIASIALSRDMTVVTRNLSDFGRNEPLQGNSAILIPPGSQTSPRRG